MLRAPLAARAAANFAANDTATDNGMEISKTATRNDDGSYTITLEAYATGSKVISEIKEDVPTDIVLVLDQSSSMTESMSTYAFRKYTDRSNAYLYSRRHDGGSNNLYYQLDDVSYATVSVTRTQGESTFIYTQCPADWQNYKSSSWNDWDPDCYWKYSNNLYVKIGEEYQKVTLTRNREYLWDEYTYTYTFPDNSTIVSEGSYTSPGDFGGKGPLYYRSETAGEYTYTYTYTDKDGEPHTIGSSTGQDTVPTDFTLYERYTTGSVERLEALKTAVTTFANSVAEKAKGKDGAYGGGDDINHRIAVVGFASGSTGNNSYPKYLNSEVFIGANQYNYSVNASSYYSSAFQDMNTQAGYDNIIASKNALDASGATHVDLGIEMANGIFRANPIGQNKQRNRVMIVFTDGVPSSWSDYDSTVASNAITKANTTKSSTGYGATVYTIGIFSGADATSAGNQNGTDTQRANWFMQQVSSNNGTPRSPSYYLSAADAGSLNSIFQQISEQIESGGSSTTLDANAVIKDIISPQFTLPDGATVADITLETYACTGKNSSDYTWSSTSSDNGGATATVNGDQVSVTGFNFSENWCGTETNAQGGITAHGKKLVIRFTVSPKAGFLGGNNVYTNAGAGVYENSDATQPVLSFPQPQVNVPIQDVTVSAQDKNVYLLGNVTAEQLKAGAEVSCGGVTLDLSKADENYGLESWQTEYVDITVEVKDADGNVISDKLEDLLDDTTYTIDVTVKPETDGVGADGTPNSMDGKSGVNDPAAKINVFKPELTFKDSEVYYGDTAPENYNGNKVSEQWKHGDKDDSAVTMTGEKPTLVLTYTPGEGIDIDKGIINTTDDIPVAVTAQIGSTDVTSHVTFKHDACNPVCGWNETTPDGDPAFLLHVKTCTLTIKKLGCEDENQSFIFKVTGGAIAQEMQVTVQENNSATIVGLPVGTYTVTEVTSWSWRYIPDLQEKTVNVQDGQDITVTFHNTRNDDKWLSGDSYAVNYVGCSNAQGTFVAGH